MHTALIALSSKKISINFFIKILSQKIFTFLKSFTKKIYSTIELVETNSFFYSRVKKIGRISNLQCNLYGLTGILLRSLGQKIDLRKKKKYELYNKVSFSIPVRNLGDTHDRLYIRIEEIIQSIKIIINKLKFLSIYKKYKSKLSLIKTSKNIQMESIILKFKTDYNTKIMNKITSSKVLKLDIEAPKGETVLKIIYNKMLSTTAVIRLFIKAPGFSHLNFYQIYLITTLSLIW